jgi:hypothetical protein
MLAEICNPFGRKETEMETQARGNYWHQQVQLSIHAIVLLHSRTSLQLLHFTHCINTK